MTTLSSKLKLYFDMNMSVNHSLDMDWIQTHDLSFLILYDHGARKSYTGLQPNKTQSIAFTIAQ